MSTSIFTGDFGELRVETEMIDVTSGLPRPDENWTYTDQHGHEHRYDDGYPTLIQVVDETYWCPDCNDEHEKTHLECRECGEHINPGLRGPSMFREFIPGPRSYYLNDEPISEQRFREIAAQYEQADG